MLIGHLIANIAEHRKRPFVPSSHLETNTTIIRHIASSATVGKGLPIYIALVRKPDNRDKIQNLANMVSGIMLKVMKSSNK
jgi:hypothetical protein